jgi:hypothetical protein
MNGMVTYMRELLIQAYTSKYATYLFLLWCGVSAVEGESMVEGSSDKNVVTGPNTIALLCLVLS